MDDTISRRDAIDAISSMFAPTPTQRDMVENCMEIIDNLPPAQSELHYCRECEWSRCHINVDKYGKSETYWWCINWVAETDEEGYCHEWKRKTDG